MRILGVDPGSRLTGYGIVSREGNALSLISHGSLRVSGDPTQDALADRLLSIHRQLSSVITAHKPTVMAVEQVFFAKNPVSALKLGQARGAAVLTGAMHGLEIFEYSSTQVKQAISGYGRSGKEQIARMVQLILRLSHTEFETFDASDGCALAICHAQFHRAPPLRAG